MPDKASDMKDEKVLDAIFAWNHRIADGSNISDASLPELTSEERSGFEVGEDAFLTQLLSGTLEGETPSVFFEPQKMADRVGRLEPIGLNRAKTVSEETADLLERQREMLIKQHEQAGAGLPSRSIVEEIDVEQEAEKVLKALDLWSLPIDPIKIATLEGIHLVEGSYGDDFDARIEFLPSIQKFAIYYQGPGPGRPKGRVNFSLAHELGHYYLHHAYLLSGASHNSESDFASKNPMERQADAFAAALLMPRELFAARVKRQSRGVCTLKDIRRLSEREFGTSITSTALRYCKCEFEACAVVLSREGAVEWADYSTDMQFLNMKFIRYGSPVPDDSWTAEVDLDDPSATTEGVIDADVWFDRPNRSELWEEAMILGRTGLTLTFLSLPDPELE